MFFLGYLVFYSTLSLLIDVSIFFSILSFVLGGTLYFNSNSLPWIVPCAWTINFNFSLCYHSKGKCARGSSFVNASTSCNFHLATVIFSIPIWYIIVKTNIIEIKSSPLYVFIPSLLISWPYF